MHKKIQHCLFCGLLLLSALMPKVLWAQWEKIPTGYFSYTAQLQSFEGQLFCHTPDGVYRSKNNGQSWEPMVRGLCCNGFLHFLNIDPATKYFYFVNEEDGQIQVSQDGGNTWQVYGQMPVNTPFFERHRGLFFYNDKVYVFQQNYLAIRDNAGPLNGWRPLLTLPVDPNTSGFIYNVIRHETHLWVESNLGVYHSSNLGQTWTKPLGDVYRQLASHGDTLLACAPGNNTVPPLLSTNNGTTWQQTQVPSDVNRISATGGKFYLTATDVASSFALFSSKDAQNWTKVAQNLYANSVLEVGKDLFLTISDYGILRGNLVKSSDGGATFAFSNDGLPRNGQVLPSARFIDGYLHLSDGLGFYEEDGNLQYKGWRGYSQAPINLFRAGNMYWGHYSNIHEPSVPQTCPANGRFEWENAASIAVKCMTSVGAQVYGVANQTALHKASADGKTWTQVGTVPQSDYLLGWRDRLYTTDGNKMVYSTDEGQSWQTAFDFGAPLNINVARFFRMGDTLFFSHVNKRGIYYIKDDGISFDTVAIPYETGATLLRFRIFNNTMALYIGNGENLYVSNDRGQTWLKLPAPPATVVNIVLDVLTANANTLIIPTASGYLWRLRYDGLRNLRGRVYYDANVNGVQDAGEVGIPDRLIQASNSGFTAQTDATGNFSVTLLAGVDTLRIPDASSAFLLNPAKVVANTADTAFIRWAFQPKRQVADAKVQLIVPIPFRAGFISPVALTVLNQGTLDVAPRLRLRLDPLLSYESSDFPLLQQTGDSVVWQLPTLKPFERFTVRLNLKASVTPPNTPVELALKAIVPQEHTPADNEALYKGATVASYDPNDKAVSPQVLPPFEMGKKELTYTIRFQNLGNIATDFVTVLDTLPIKIDPAQIRILGSSHPMRWRLLSGRVLEFKFNPLHLPPAAQDEPGSHGFVQFTAGVRPGLKEGEAIRNKAYIYFDFNPAIITNTAVTESKTVSVRPPSLGVQALSCFPNPARTQITLRCAATAPGQINVFDALGKQYFSAPVAGSEYTLSVETWASGVYQVYWQVGAVVYGGSLVVGD